ncbi:MAG: hypothetical protein RMI49_03880 [Candidatus Caldarchaeum sp.]|nr:hypothetical protein [Candidatus Caldarchaeum sp.]
MEPKHFVEVKLAEKAFKVEKDVLEAVKNVVKGKMLARMRKEYVDCPVAGEPVAFLSCYACVSHIRRVRGVVHCAGGERRTRA